MFATPEIQARAAAAVDEGRLWARLMALAEIGATANGGVCRQALTEEDAAARRRLVDWAGELGFSCFTDPIGNLFVRREGGEPGALPVLAGSHLDSQPTGGKFDGAYGVLAAFEALEAMERAGLRPRRPIEAVAWTNEEGGRFQPSAMGSACFAGHMRFDGVLGALDKAGVRLSDALDRFLAATPELPQRPLGFPVAGYVEAHIEQGPLLEAEGKTIGAVLGVQGQRWYAVEVQGEEAHAGTTPRAGRRDALKAAAAIVLALEREFADAADLVRFTVGRFEVFPGSPNTVPGRVFFTIDFRHPDAETIAELTVRIEPLAQAAAGHCGVTVKRTSNVAPTAFDSSVVEAVRRNAAALGLPCMDIFSGAGHDAMHLAKLCPAGMVFVPCARGVSHNEAESATPADLAAGARVLAATLAGLAGR